jgi:hypothetical protein
MPLTIYPLTIGSITLNQDAFEGPNGDQAGLTDLGSRQKAVVHEFPGGIITAQLYGSYSKTITWSGKLFGSNAVSRSFQLQKLCDNGNQITLAWNQWSFDGFVEDYEATARGPNEIDYKIVFRTVVNNSTVSGGNAPANVDPFSSTLANAQTTATQQATAPASGGTLPATVPPLVSDLNDSISQSLQASGGSVSAIPSVTAAPIQGQISDIQDLLDPVINGSDPLAASAAADLNGTLGIMSTSLGDSISPTITTIQAVNPNLYSLAAQYYSDPTQYGLIADANGLTDPLPITNGPISLVIPAQPAGTITSYTPTVMQDALAAA